MRHDTHTRAANATKLCLRVASLLVPAARGSRLEVSICACVWALNGILAMAKVPYMLYCWCILLPRFIHISPPHRLYFTCWWIECKYICLYYPYLMMDANADRMQEMGKEVNIRSNQDRIFASAKRCVALLMLLMLPIESSRRVREYDIICWRCLRVYDQCIVCFVS